MGALDFGKNRRQFCDLYQPKRDLGYFLTIFFMKANVDFCEKFIFLGTQYHLFDFGDRKE